MTRAALLAASLAATTAFVLLDREAIAGGRQLHGGPMGGAAILLGSDVLVGGNVGGQLAYGITDAFRAYGSLELAAGAGVTRGAFAVWPGISAGIAYSLDVGTWVPWLGLEARAHLVYGQPATSWAVGGGARLGVDWLPQRYLGLSVQVAYAALYLDGGLGHSVALIAGPRWTVDL